MKFPASFEGKVWAVYKTDCKTPDRPLAIFGYEDEARAWAQFYFNQIADMRWEFGTGKNLPPLPKSVVIKGHRRKKGK